MTSNQFGGFLNHSQDRRTLDRLLEHVATELTHEGQYNPFGFTPPPTPSSAPCTALGPAPWSDPRPPIGSFRQWSGVDDLYTSQHMSMNGSFMNNGTKDNVLNAMVGNWAPTSTGTYSPFGSGVPPLNVAPGPVPAAPIFKPEPPPQPEPPKRARPSYSDVLSRSPPPNQAQASTPPLPLTRTKSAPGLKGKARKGSLSRQHSGEGERGGKREEGKKKHHHHHPKEEKTPRVIRLVDLQPSKVELTATNAEACNGKDVKEDIKEVNGSAWETVPEHNSFKSKSGHGEKSVSDTTFLNNDKVVSSNQPKQPPQKSPMYINNNLKTSWLNGGPEKNVARESSSGSAAPAPPTPIATSPKNCMACSHEKKGSGTGGGSGGAAAATAAAAASSGGGGGGQQGGGQKGKGASGVNCIPAGLPRTEKVTKEPLMRKGHRSGKRREGETFLIVTLCQLTALYCQRWGCMALFATFWLLQLLYDVVTMSSRLLAHLGVRTWNWILYRGMVGVLHTWNWAKVRFRQVINSLRTSPVADTCSLGLDCNISLPSTGEEALKRLLSCKGKDPYSILGVTQSCTDEDIKKYYKRQAFLVHPDKNHQLGAEEAFKILAHAFELIGEPEKRAEYDLRAAQVRAQREQQRDELSDLVEQLHRKMEEVANTIRCTNCNKRHRRMHTDRPCYAARFCSQCKIHHAAREGDIWAESSMLGFLWHYYACMEGVVYDITEWAACQVENLKHLRANSHSVQYRIVLGRRHASHHRQQPAQYPSDADLEDILNNFYNGTRGETPNQGSNMSGRHESSRRNKGKKRK